MADIKNARDADIVIKELKDSIEKRFGWSEKLIYFALGLIATMAGIGWEIRQGVNRVEVDVAVLKTQVASVEKSISEIKGFEKDLAERLDHLEKLSAQGRITRDGAGLD